LEGRMPAGLAVTMLPIAKSLRAWAMKRTIVVDRRMKFWGDRCKNKSGEKSEFL
jgi:hypothetical protein